MASGEGIEDALACQPSMLVQTDEIDSVLSSIATSRDGRHEALLSMLLTLYTSSGGAVPCRLKAGQTERRVIEQPHLVLFGTAIPNHFYGALSDRMLTNGFFGRLMVFESGPRGAGQEPMRLAIPARVMETTRWWAEFSPRSGSSIDRHKPEPRIVEVTAEALSILVDSRRRAEVNYSAAEAAQDTVGTTVWGRLPEQARKLALIYAVSEDHQEPRIGAPAARWASALVEHQARRMADRKPRAEATPEARRAQRRIAYRVATGALIRPCRCEQCDSEGPIEAAHFDYAEPERVRWLCRYCHRAWDQACPKRGTV
jgi:hypothetical protein